MNRRAGTAGGRRRGKVRGGPPPAAGRTLAAAMLAEILQHFPPTGPIHFSHRFEGSGGGRASGRKRTAGLEAAEPIDRSSPGAEVAGDAPGPGNEPPQPDGDGGQAQAKATVTLALQRWLTLRRLIDTYSRPHLDKLDPRVGGILLAGATQLLFMPSQPPFAVVDDLVECCRTSVHPKATGLINAVLRRIAECVGSREPDLPWAPAEDRLPLETGGTLLLTRPVLPSPEAGVDLLEVALSHPARLLRSWIRQFGEQQAIANALHGLDHPPIVVALEPGFDDWGSHQDSLAAHRLPDFGVWQGTMDALPGFLAGHAERRVQDPTASLPLARFCEVILEEGRGSGEVAERLGGMRVLDFCAGRGTKTAQWLARNPKSEVWVHEPDVERRRYLEDPAGRLPQVRFLDDLGAADAPVGKCDLVLLDVPCSNTGVLGRRVEARYRFTARAMRSLVELQQRIIEQAMPFMTPTGHVVYSTCSLEKEENQDQARQMAEHFGLELVEEVLTLPRGCGMRSQDGGYFAILRRAAGGGC